MPLNLSQPYAVIVNDGTGRVFEQGGSFYRGDGTLWTAPATHDEAVSVVRVGSGNTVTGIVLPDGTVASVGTTLPELGARQLLAADQYGETLTCVHQIRPPTGGSISADSATLSTGQLAGGIVTILNVQHPDGTSPVTLTLPTAAELHAEAPWIADSPSFGTVGLSLLVIIRNVNSSSGAVTLVANTGFSFHGGASNTIAAGKARMYQFAAIDDYTFEIMNVGLFDC